MSEDKMLNTRAQLSLTEALRRGDLRAGQFLSMPQMVGILGYPLAAVREAVRHAGASGWLDIIPKRGVQVLEARPDTIRDTLDARMVLDQEGARRRIAAGVLDGLSDLRASHQALLAETMGQGEPELSSRAIGIDLSLHDYLADGLGNPLLRAAYEANRVRMAIFQRVRPFVQERIKSAMQEHLAIISALERRDGGAAVAAIAHHCERTRHWWGVPA
ncbi:GntR family transcriptional regulator [Paracoccus lutimaris]|uniref:DNA-binding GntR family transcriptional regulator n=1 Tax=Paracoccus lutimaris TaxID=1490030 RepID=A0A368Z776_9RHOB|nr:GntR family transcriptional regulator [Paracoccus lutimaris]RCW87007.1 DNA-binding GntR family transcriptional regulator [Paracoccus lutimaris]